MVEPSEENQENRSDLNFLRRRKDEMSGIGAIATALAVILAFGGLILAHLQLESSEQMLKRAQDSIDLATKSLEASTIYAIQRDGRELLRSLQTDQKLFTYIYQFRDDAAYDEDVVSKADLKIAEIIQYFSSVFNQKRNGVISDTYWDTFAQEICSFLQEKPVSEFWVKKAVRGKYSKEFKEFGNNCLNSGSEGG